MKKSSRASKAFSIFKFIKQMEALSFFRLVAYVITSICSKILLILKPPWISKTLWTTNMSGSGGKKGGTQQI